MAVRARADEAYVCIYMEIWENGKKDYQMILWKLPNSGIKILLLNKINIERVAEYSEVLHSMS